MKATKERIRAIKAELGQSSCVLGDTSQKTNYDTTTKSALALAHKLSVKQDIIDRPKNVSSIYFGSNPNEYQTETKRSSASLGKSDRLQYVQRKQEMSQMKTNLLRRNFSFGEEEVEYISDYQRGYVALSPEVYKSGLHREGMKEYLKDVRKCHFSLGQDEVDYKSNTSK
jgi:hypothetical protein